MLPTLTRMAGARYLATAAVLGAVLGAVFVALAVAGLWPRAGRRWARSLFGYSMVYLTGLFVALVADRT